MGYKVIVIVSGAIALICIYLVYMAVAVDDHGGMGLFAAFGLMFATLPIADIGKMLTRRSPLAL